MCRPQNLHYLVEAATSEFSRDANGDEVTITEVACDTSIDTEKCIRTARAYRFMNGTLQSSDTIIEFPAKLA